MKSVLLFATPYPYTCGIIALIWGSGAVLLKADPQLALGVVLITNSLATLIVASIGFRK